ncbi:MAG: ABC transporter permease subunit [Anaerolineaceae bacterium]|nr:ABC transporter permease subunit [Anaerolineaceae bacterium]
MIQREAPFRIRQGIAALLRPLSAFLAGVLRPFLPILRPLISVLADERVRRILGQLIFAAILIFFFWLIGTTAANELEQKGLVPTFRFLNLRSGFEISESPGWYSGDSSYGRAFVVGMINTVRVVVLGLVLASVLGLFVGVFLLSSNWLIRSIARGYVELLRNTPLLVQIFVWYFVVMFSLPRIQDAITLPNEGITFISLRIVLWLVLWLVLGRYWRAWGVSVERRVALQYGFTALVVVSELAAYGHHEIDGWPWAWGAGLSGEFWGYLFVSAVLLALVWGVYNVETVKQRMAPLWRPRLLGIALGQLLAGTLFSLGWLPMAAFRLELQPAVYISIRGFVFPEILPTARFASWFAFVALGILLAGFIWVWLGRRTEDTGQPYPRGSLCIAAVVGLAIIGWVVVGMADAPSHVVVESQGEAEIMPLVEAKAEGTLGTEALLLTSTRPLMLQLPTQNRFGRFLTGVEFTPEFMALLLGLVIYTSSFIAEIVRAGIQAVPRGQIEAGRALGLSQTQLLTRIIFPQALRVIIPPLGNQYLNLSKNSSLAITIGYADTFNITTTIMNQSGQTVTGFFIVMVFYLSLSLLISAIMNAINSRFRLVTR